MPLFLLILCFAICGCTPLVSSSNQAMNSIGSVSQTNVCPKQPTGSLSQSDVKAIALTSTEINETGQIRVGQNFGYVFDAKAKQKIGFNTKENLCLYVYTPSNQLLNGSELPENGKYTVQVAVPSGTTTFNLAMKFVSNDVAQNTVSKNTKPLVNPQPTPQIIQSQVAQPVTSQNIRVGFSDGSTGTSINGNVTTSQINRYLLDCGSGQSMSIRVFDGNINLSIIDPNGRNIGIVKNNFWQGKLPMNGDYTLEVSSKSGSNYKLNIEVI